jgi:hypothetical protein
MEGMEGFKPSFENKRAQDEEKERASMRFHNRGLHDEEGSEGVDEATGTKETTAEVDGADESKSIKIKKDKSGDVMGKMRGELPKDLKGMAEWMRKEEERLNKAKQNRKKAA